MKKNILQLNFLVIIALTTFSIKANTQYWRLKGNAGTDPNVNFIGTTDAQSLAFRTNNVERMRIFKGGKIGIGIKNPAARLNIVSTDYVSLGTPGYLMLGDVNGYNMAMDVNVIQARYNGTASNIYLNYYGGYTYLGPSAAVVVNTTGNLTTTYPVGIRGGTNASYALNVNGGASYGGVIITDPVDNTALIFTKSGINSGAVFSKTNISSGVETVSSTNSGSGAGIYASSTNYVGVMGVSTNYHGVYGYTGGTQASGEYAGYFAGAVNASGGYYTTSDENLKKNIKDFSSAMDIIAELRPKAYEFRNEGDYKLINLPEGIHYGLLAQEVEKILPGVVANNKFQTRLAKHAITEADAQNSKTYMFKSLNYTELIPILIKGMQEQQSIIDQQQQQIDELKQLVQNVFSSNSPDAKAIGATAGVYVIQNVPNPFSENTTIKCYVPYSVKQAQLAVYNMKGQLIKSYKLASGINNVNITAGSLASGQYTYSFLADGKKIDSKSMVMTK